MPGILSSLPGYNKKKAVVDCCCNKGCCDNRCVPLVVRTINGELVEVENDECDNPLPLELKADVTATPSYGDFTCFNDSTTLTFKTPFSGGTNCWEGRVSGSCTDCNGGLFTYEYDIVVCCLNIDNEYRVSIVPVATTCPAETLPETVGASFCDPLLLQGCWPEIGGCFVSCLDDTTPVPSPSFELCFQIYEVP